MAQRNIVDITDLEVKFYTYAGVVEALDGVNISIKEGEILGLVGETGCGKSVTSLSIMRLVPPPGKVEGGKIVFSSPTKQQEIMTMDESSLRGMRGKDISMIFQEPRAYLNPVYTVENQIAEVMHVHRKNELLQNSIDSIRKRLVEKRARSRQQRAGKKPEERPKRLGFRGSGQKLRLQTRIASIEKKEVDLRKQMLDMEKQGVDLEKQKATKKQKVRLQRRKMKLEHLLSNLV